MKDFLNGLIEMPDHSRNTDAAVDAELIKQIKLEQNSDQGSDSQRLGSREKDVDRRKKITVRYLFERLDRFSIGLFLKKGLLPVLYVLSTK